MAATGRGGPTLSAEFSRRRQRSSHLFHPHLGSPDQARKVLLENWFFGKSDRAVTRLWNGSRWVSPSTGVSGAEVDPMDFGGVGNGIADDTAALLAAYVATPPGGTLRFTRMHRITSTVTFSKQIRVTGTGDGSGVYVAVGAGNDGLVFDSGSTGAVLYGIVAENFAVLGGDDAARYALVVRNIAHSTFRSIWAKAGSTYAVSIEGSLINWFNFILPGVNAGFPYAATASTNGMRVVGSTNYPANANRIDCIVEAITGHGLTIDGTIGAGGDYNNWISGTYEGIGGDGIALIACREFSLRDTHLEGSAGQNKLTLDSCQRGAVGPGIFCATDIELGLSNDITLEGVSTNNLSIAADCQNIHLGERVNYGINGGTLTWASPSTTSSKRVVGETTWDPPSIADGLITTKGITVTGAVPGDTVQLGFTTAVPAGALLTGSVSAADVVQATLFNKTGAALDLASGTLRAEVTKRIP